MRDFTRGASFRTVSLLIVGMMLFFPACSKAEDEHTAVEEKAPVKAQSQEKGSLEPLVRIKTSAGDILIELTRKHAPISTDNFLHYARSGGYNGTIFHRVIPGFMIQGGGFDKGMNKRPTQSAIRNEATNGLRNDTGTVAMARTNVVDSATNQFFINCKNNDFLNHRSPDPRGYGYAVFGKVVKGMEVVRTIEKTPTGTRGRYRDVPLEDIIIESVVIERP